MRNSILCFILGAAFIAAIYFGISGLSNRRQAEQLTEAAFAYTPPAATEPVQPALTADTLYALVKSSSQLITATHQYVNTDTISEHAKPLGFDLTFFRDEVQYTYRGCISFGIDLRDVAFDVNQASRVIYVTLPAPAIVSHAVDTSSFVFNTKRDSWFTEIDPDVFVARANSLKHEQEVRAFASGDAIREASRSAESTLTSLLTDASVTDGYRLRFFTKS